MTKQLSFSYGSEVIHYRVEWVRTRRTLGIEVYPDQSVVVRAPIGSPEHLVTARVRRRAGWICRQITYFKRFNPRTPTRQYLSGETHLYLGRQYRLKVLRGNQPSVKISRGLLTVTLAEVPSSERVEQLLRDWYRERAKEKFLEVVEQLLTRFRGYAPPRLIVRTMRSRWGSMALTGTMTLNQKLIQTPRACIEYVVAHELCHYMHRNHDPAFFRALGRLMPDWEKRKERLELALL